MERNMVYGNKKEPSAEFVQSLPKVISFFIWFLKSEAGLQIVRV